MSLRDVLSHRVQGEQSAGGGGGDRGVASRGARHRAGARRAASRPASQLWPGFRTGVMAARGGGTETLRRPGKVIIGASRSLNDLRLRSDGPLVKQTQGEQLKIEGKLKKNGNLSQKHDRSYRPVAYNLSKFPAAHRSRVSSSQGSRSCSSPESAPLSSHTSNHCHLPMFR